MNFTKIHTTIFLVVSILALSLFGGCGTDEENEPEMIEYRQARLPDEQPPQQLPELEPLSPEIEKQIIADYRLYRTDKDGQTYTGEVWIDTYCGTYNGYVAVLMNGDFADEQVRRETPIKFYSGISFVYANNSDVLVWEKAAFFTPGQFHSLYGAFNRSFLTEDDFKKIAYYNNRKLIPYEGHPVLEFLNPKIEKQILKDYKSLFFTPFIFIPLTSRIRMAAYYGTYNGYVVAKLSPLYLPYETGLWNAIIADTFFSSSSAQLIKVWKKEGEFYSLERAYEKGFLTPNDIKSIAYYDWHTLYIHYDIYYEDEIYTEGGVASVRVNLFPDGNTE